MRQGTKSSGAANLADRAGEFDQTADASAQTPRPATRPGSRRRWLTEPKAAIWIALVTAAVVGGGRRLITWWQARKGVARLDDPAVSLTEIEAVAEFGRTGVYELLRIFSSTMAEPARLAAGRALARLWLLDQLVAEEEQAVVRRGFTVTWKARRRYPRSIKTEIPIAVAYEVPFLDESGRRVAPSNLEWSHRILGARRATLEEFSPWMPGPGHVAFTIFPGDFETNGPHRLVLQARVRTRGLTDSWEIELPHVPFLFEFDPILKLDAIMTLPDASRDEQMARAIRLEVATMADDESPTYVSLGHAWALRRPPRLAVNLPLMCDLAHDVFMEIDGVTGRLAAGSLMVTGQGLARTGQEPAGADVRRFDLQPTASLAADAIERSGMRPMRLWLEAAPDRGWSDPDVRSIWPGRLETNWVDVEIVRR